MKLGPNIKRLSSISLKSTKRIAPEREILAAVLDGLETVWPGAFDRVNNVPAYNTARQFSYKPHKFARPGIADIIGCVGGQFIAIEVKKYTEYKWLENFIKKIKKENKTIDVYTPTNKKEEHFLQQLKWQQQKKNNGALAFFTYSVDHCMDQLKILNEGLNRCAH